MTQGWHQTSNNSAPLAMTVDLEDYFQVSAFNGVVSREQWGEKYPLRVVESTRKLLDLFENHNVKATFFVLGWVAERCPALVAEIHQKGHEIACHGFHHQRVTELDRHGFEADVSRAKLLLESITGEAVRGYRAPSFSINTSNEWAFSVLAEMGFTFSSSTYPVQHDHYGVPEWPRFIHKRPEGITEIPIPTLSLMGRNIPIGGGGYFRLYPLGVTTRLIDRYLNDTGAPFSLYIHPWELDPGQPRMQGIPLKTKFRHYLNLNRTEHRLNRLFSLYRWDTMSRVYQLDTDLFRGHQRDSVITDFATG
ncbi:DUF3473 domain-containing protein [Parasalinivibrio latis]|uniref:XrtA system polysaccharide deacetylase n=1 Tax=Parasalinivibrio latis TaxID=2952610 RepID=UPI0030E07DA6